MLLTIPIYLEGRRAADGPTVYAARPLFFAGPEVRGERIDRLLARLGLALAEQFQKLGKLSRHDDLAACTFNPPLRTQRLDLALQLRRRTARGRFLVVLFRQFGRRLAFTPSLPELWFDVA